MKVELKYNDVVIRIVKIKRFEEIRYCQSVIYFYICNSIIKWCKCFWKMFLFFIELNIYLFYFVDSYFFFKYCLKEIKL